MIPSNITREDILKALEFIDANGVPNIRKEKNRILIYEGKSYPVKYVISIANKYRNGKELDSEEFISKETRSFLVNLGFEVKLKDEINHNSSVYWFTIAESISDYYYNGIENEVWGVIDSLEYRIKTLKDGDYILFYGSEIGFSLCKTVGSTFRDDNPLYYNENFPHRIKITKPILETKSKSFSDIRECLRDTNGNPYSSPNSAAKSIGGTPGVFRKLRPEEIKCIFSALDWKEVVRIGISSDVSAFNILLKSKKQIILYGPPGTGKTFKARNIAVNFIEKVSE